mgnify:CR=1 FL=1
MGILPKPLLLPEDIGIKGEYDENPYHKTDETEIFRFCILQGQQGERVEKQAASGPSSQIQT